jgi:hypothetical protein
MTASLPANDPGNDTDDTQRAALDEDAAPDTGSEPDTAGPEGATEPDVAGVPATGADEAARTILDGPALENEEMRRGTEDLQSSQDKIAQAREFADEVARTTEPEPPARPGDES